MLKTLISTTISHKELNFKPGSTPTSFEVWVVNESDRFATFQLELLAPGAEAYTKRRWYELSPEVSTKKPPGDRTRFRITITDTPIPGFTGLINVTIRIFSLELGEDRKLLRLNLEPGAEIPLEIGLPVKQFQAYPLDQVEIPVRIHNPSYKMVDAIVRLTGIASSWLSEGTEQRIQLDRGASIEVVYLCLIPPVTQAFSDRYPFTVQVTHQGGLPASVTGVLEVLPTGYVEFDCTPTQHQLPPQSSGFWHWWINSVPYTLQFSNQSNVPSRMSVQIQGEDREQCTFQLLPDHVPVQPGEKVPVQLSVTTRRPWLGFSRLLLFALKAEIANSEIDLRNDTQVIKLKVRPKLPLWAQLLGVLLLLYGLWWCSWFNPESLWFGHKAAVNSVQFNGVGNEILSASDDQSIIHWDTPGFFNPLVNQQIEVLGGTQKSVRVIRYRPINNDWVAAGLENGEIQFWHLGSPQKVSTFLYQKDDRVLSLAFTKNSNYLFSGHGSGQVLQWQTSSVNSEAGLPEKFNPSRQHQFDFAVYGMALVGANDKNLLVGGRYNRLALWNWETDVTRPIAYPRTGGQDDYITSLSHATYRPYLLASSDNQGHITLWDLRPCLLEGKACQVLDEWQDGHEGKPVRQVAISEYGCYLASAGADGRVKLWVLTPEGKRSARYIDGLLLKKSLKPFNTVDIKVVDDSILVVAGNDNTQVSLSKEARKPEAQCDVPKGLF